MEFTGHDLIRLFDCEPELLDGLDAPTAEHLRHRFCARSAWAEVGPWEPTWDAAELAGHFGLLVIEGLLIRTVRLGGRSCTEILGPGDLARPWDEAEAVSVECTNAWRVLRPTTFAVLDAAFAGRIAPWPTIAVQLLSRSTRRCRTLVYQAAIAHIRHAETRVQLLLWHLADRWGRVTAEGVVVPVPLTHELLAQMTCLRRPTVSAALSHLAGAGTVTRDRHGWLLHGPPPSVAVAVAEPVTLLAA